MVQSVLTNTAVMEWVWSIVCFVGLVTTAWLLRESIVDRDVLLASGRNGPSAKLANGLVRTEVMRTLQLLVMTALGVGALLSPDPVASWTITFRVVAAWAITLVAVLTTIDALLDRKMRYDVDNAISKIYTGGGTYRNDET